jgi:hypothetical protein
MELPSEGHPLEMVEASGLYLFRVRGCEDDEVVFSIGEQRLGSVLALLGQYLTYSLREIGQLSIAAKSLRTLNELAVNRDREREMEREREGKDPIKDVEEDSSLLLPQSQLQSQSRLAKTEGLLHAEKFCEPCVLLHGLLHTENLPRWLCLRSFLLTAVLNGPPSDHDGKHASSSLVTLRARALLAKIDLLMKSLSGLLEEMDSPLIEVVLPISYG